MDIAKELKALVIFFNAVTANPKHFNVRVVKASLNAIAGLIIFIGVCGVAQAASEKTYGDVVITKVLSVYDGDTFKVAIDTYPAIVGEEIGIRVSGIDTPEIRSKSAPEKALAQKAKAEATKMLTNGKIVELKNMRRDKYFRILAEVYVDGESLAQRLINKGLAVPYDGGKKLSWDNGFPEAKQ